MSDYRRLISYIYSYENGIKTGNTGFARVESRGGVCKVNLSLRISKALANEADGNMLEVFMFTRRDGSVYKTNIGRIKIVNGNSMFRGQYHAEEIGNARLPLSDIVGIFICSRAFLNRNSMVNIVYASEWDDTTILVEEFAGIDEFAAEGKSAEAKQEILAEAEQGVPAEAEQGISAAELTYAKVNVTPQVKENLNMQNSDNDNVKMYEKQLQEILKKSDNHYEKQVGKNDSNFYGQVNENAGKTVDKGDANQNRNVSDNSDMRRDMSSDIGSDINRDMSSDIDSDINRDMSSDIDSDINRDMSSDVNSDTNQDMSASPDSDINQGMSSNPGSNTNQNTSSYNNRPRTPGNADYFRMLCNCYPKIRVDELSGDCIKITPHDISYLPKKYWHLCNNSFLLHSFYNYRYILLCEEDNRQTDNTGGSGENDNSDEKQYMICVPGMYQKKEQSMAGMYGFTKFKGKEQSEIKNFGYWCMYL